jgi:hypothetical protein
MSRREYPIAQALLIAHKLTLVQEIRDQVLQGVLDPSACCSYGTCKGDVNVSGG